MKHLREVLSWMPMYVYALFVKGQCMFGLCRLGHNVGDWLKCVRFEFGFAEVYSESAFGDTKLHACPIIKTLKFRKLGL